MAIGVQEAPHENQCCHNERDRMEDGPL
jgi:hypothetical protein